MPAFRQFNAQSLKLGTQARALTGCCGLGHSSLLKLGLAAGAFSFTNGGHYFRLLSKGPTYGGPGGNFFELEHDRSGGRHLRFRFDPDPRPADLCVALHVTRSLSVGPRGAFERRGSGQPDLDAVGRLAVAREKAPSDEVVEDQAGDRERDVRDPAPKVRAVAALLLRGGRSPRRARSPRRRRGEGSQQRRAVLAAREPRRGDQDYRERAVVEGEHLDPPHANLTPGDRSRPCPDC